MKIFDLGLFREARVWQGSLPDSSFPSSEFIGATISISARSEGLKPPPDGSNTFCVEFKTNLGGRIGYGLLGARFAPDASSLLSIKVPVKNEAWRVFSTPLYTSDTVFVGLPTILADWVLNGALEYFGATAPRFGGELDFVVAAFSEVGSSPDIFRCLASANCYYLTSGDRNADGANFSTMFSLITNSPEQ
jgi:hypothetical protein